LRLLYLGDSALARESFQDAPHAIQIVEPDRQSTNGANPIPVDAPAPGQKFPFDVVLAEHGRASVDIFAILKDLTVRRLQVPVIFVVEWDEALIVPALKMGAVDYVLKTKAAFEALSIRIDRLRSGSILAREFDDLLRQQAELRASLDQATDARAALEVRLADAERTGQATAEQHAAVMQTAAELQQQQTQYQTELARTTEARDVLAEQLKDATSALDQAREKQASDAAAADRLARREAQLAVQLDEEAAARHALQQELIESEQRASEERKATAQESSQLRAKFEERLAEELAGREEATRKLKDLTKALEQTRRARAADATTAAEQLSRREHELSEAIAETAATRDVLEQRLTAAEAALRAAVERANEDREALLDDAERRQTELQERLDREATLRGSLEIKLGAADAAIAETTSARNALSFRLAEVQAALQHTERRAVADREALVAAGSKREADFEARLADAANVRHALEQKVAATEATLRDTIERHASEMASASDRLVTERETLVEAASKREFDFETRLADAGAVRRALEEKVAGTETTLRETIDRHASEMASASERLTRREGELTSEIDDMTAKLAAVEHRLDASEVALQQAEKRAADERDAAAREASRQRAEFDSRLEHAIQAHRALEQTLAASEASLRDAAERRTKEIAQSETQLAEMAVVRELLQQQLNDISTALENALQARTMEAADAAERLQRRESELTSALNAYRAECDAKFAEAAQVRATLERQLKDTSLALDDTNKAWAVDVSAAADRLARREAELTAAFTAYRADCDTKFAEAAQIRSTLEWRLNDTSLALDDTKKAWAMDASAAADLLTRREAELTAYRAESEAKLAEAANSRRTLEQQLKDAMQSLSEMMRAGQALEARVSERDAQLKNQSDLHRQQFERSPSSMLQCSRDGAIEQVNDAMFAMLGYRAQHKAKGFVFATAVFVSQDDWRWLIERCVETRTTVSLDTLWKKKDGVRIPVRLRAVPSPLGHIDVVAENLTSYRDLEEKLRRSERMEAVGRLASEVASTCDKMLQDAGRDGYAWLSAVGDSPIRQQGEAFLNDITRAATFLRQLDVYSRTQSASAGPVDLNRALRNLMSVLKRVAGDDIEFVLPKHSSPVRIDVELDRVERILVNVAAYGRERMPFGGRLKFDFANVMVGQDFVAKHPDLRPGPHVLVTVTAVRYAVWSDASRTLPRLSDAPTPAEQAKDRVGVDLSAIQGLIRGCGGRLWLVAEPPGDMVLQIHLPQSTAGGAGVLRASMPRPVQRWLHPGR
jgi:PAS domain S-box-containing protein